MTFISKSKKDLKLEKKLENKRNRELQRELSQKRSEIDAQIKETRAKNKKDGIRPNKQSDFRFDKTVRIKAKTTAKSIPYKKMHSNDILELPNGKFSKTYRILDINYLSAKYDDRVDIFSEYVNWLNSLSSEILAQISIINHPLDANSLKKDILIKDDSHDIIDPIFGINLKDEYNDILQGFLNKGTTYRRRDKYLSITLMARDTEEANRKFVDIEADTQRRFRQLAGGGIEALTNNEKIKLLTEFYRNVIELDEDAENQFIKSGSISHNVLNSKDFLDEELDISLEKNFISADSIRYTNKHIILNEETFVKVLCLRELATDVTDELINNILNTQIDLTLTINIKPIDLSKAKAKVQDKVLSIQKTLIRRHQRMAKRKIFIPDTDSVLPKPIKDKQQAINETKELIDDKKQKLFSFNMLIAIKGNSLEDITRKENRVNAILGSALCEVGSLNHVQDIAFQSVLPIGFNNINIKRTIHSEAMGLFIPFDWQKTIQKGGFFYSLHRDNKQPIVINNNKLKSPSGFILGSTGAGKGMVIKPLIAYILMTTDDDVIIIDPENENERFVDSLGGQGIELSSIGADRINPFDIPIDDEDFMSGTPAHELKIDLMLSLINFMSGGVNIEVIRSVVDRILKKIYEKFQKNKNSNDLPTFQDFYNELSKLNGEVERYLLQTMEIFVTGSWDLFAHKTNVQTDSRFICYNTSRVGENLKPIASFIMFDTIWNRIAKNRNTKKNTWVFVDEAHLLFKNADEISRLEAMYRRIRKYNGRIYSITQNTNDLLRWQEAQNMLANSDFIVILNQKKNDRDLIQKLLNIPDTIIDSITNSNKGEGIIYAGNSFMPFSNLFPSNTRWYELMTTDGSELAVIIAKEQLQKQENLKLYGTEYINQVTKQNISEIEIPIQQIEPDILMNEIDTRITSKELVLN